MEIKKTGNLINDKNGWIRIVEVFLAILLIVGVLLIVINSQSFNGRDAGIEVYDMQISILRSIELNESLRSDILSATLPVHWSDFSDDLPNVKNVIEDKTFSSFTCQAELCEIDSSCLLVNSNETTLYVQSLIIGSDLDTYSLRKLNLFCF